MTLGGRTFIHIASLVSISFTISLAVRVDRQGSENAFDAFRRVVGIHREYDEVDLQARMALFEQRLEEVKRHNAQPGVSWLAGINKFSDFTDSEYKALLGHRPIRRQAAPAESNSFLQLSPSKNTVETVDWRTLTGTTSVKDQGACGSCWAVAAAGAMEMHGEIAGKAITVSHQQLVDCTPNPQSCGGTGGCDGATTELAFKYAVEKGLQAADDYQSHDGTCSDSDTTSHPALNIASFVTLPVNKQAPLEQALSDKGPVAVSVDAGSWGSYSSGVFDQCDKNAIINHAVLAMGFGTDSTLGKYWLIRNSWGADWGEEGYVRLKKLDTDEGDAGNCGIDNKPLDGVGCVGGPDELPVCGMCGVLSDSAYPEGVTHPTHP